MRTSGIRLSLTIILGSRACLRIYGGGSLDIVPFRAACPRVAGSSRAGPPRVLSVPQGSRGWQSRCLSFRPSVSVEPYPSPRPSCSPAGDTANSGHSQHAGRPRVLHVPADPGAYPAQSFWVIHSQSTFQTWPQSTKHGCPATSVGKT